MTNKGERNRIEKKIYKKRLRNYGIEGDMFCLKSTGKPCSCYLCSPQKYDRNLKHKNKLIEDELILEDDLQREVDKRIDEELNDEFNEIKKLLNK